MTEQAEPAEPAIDSSELVRRLWDEVRRSAEAPYVATVPDPGPAPALIYDSDLAVLNSGAELTTDAALNHVVALLNTVAERHDELIVEMRLLRQAMKSEAERLAQRNDTLHRLLESRHPNDPHDGGHGR